MANTNQNNCTPATQYPSNFWDEVVKKMKAGQGTPEYGPAVISVPGGNHEWWQSAQSGRPTQD